MAAEWAEEFERSEHLYREGAELARAEGEQAWLATAVSALGLLELDRENFAGALELSEQALQLCRDLGDDWNAARASGRSMTFDEAVEYALAS